MFHRDQSTPFRDGAKVNDDILRLLDIRVERNVNSPEEKLYSLEEVARLLKAGKIVLPVLPLNRP